MHPADAEITASATKKLKAVYQSEALTTGSAQSAFDGTGCTRARDYCAARRCQNILFRDSSLDFNDRKATKRRVEAFGIWMKLDPAIDTSNQREDGAGILKLYPPKADKVKPRKIQVTD